MSTSKAPPRPFLLAGRLTESHVLGMLLGLTTLALTVKFILGIGFKLPVPVGDSIFFLDPAANLCGRGFLGTNLLHFDASGQGRYVWHGFLAPWLYATLNPNCSATGFYVVRFAIMMAGLTLTYLLARTYGLSPWQALAAGLLTFATQSKLGFRPELLAIPLMLAIELTIRRGRWTAAAFLAGMLLWTQPVLFSLYGLFVALVRPKALWGALGVWPVAGFASSVLIFAWLYPFPLPDLLAGILAQGSSLADRTDGGFVGYYLVTHFLPAWSLLFLAAFLIVARTHPLLLLMLPVLWWFGPRVPPTNYNLQALLPCILLMAAFTVTPRTRVYLVAAGAVIGLAGLAQSSLRDIATVVLAGDTYSNARHMYLADRTDDKVTIERQPIFAGVWTADPAVPGTSDLAEATALDSARPRASKTIAYSHMSGRAESPCPDQSPNAVPFRILDRTIFNSPSGWGVYRCWQYQDAVGSSTGIKADLLDGHGKLARDLTAR